MNLNLDTELLKRQTIALSNVLARCDDDADSPCVTIYIEEAELLEGVWNLCAGLLESGIPRRHLIDAARGLAATDNSNPEYNRALVELVMDSIGLSMDDKDEGYMLIGLEPPADMVH